MSDSDLDSDLNDPDVEELELLRRALGAQYTAEGDDVYEDDPDEDGSPDELNGASCQPRDQLLLDADTALAGSAPLQPALPSLQQQAVQHLNSREFGGAPDNNILEGAANDEGGDEDEDGDGGEAEEHEEWEPAQTRTELLQDAVQYLQQVSAEQQRLDELVLYAQDEDLPQEETVIHRLERALEANRRLQARLVGILEAVDGAIWDNAQAQAALARNSALHPRAGRYRGMRGVSNATWGQADVQVVGPSQFWVAGRHVPEPNTDTLKTAPVFQYLPQQFKDSTWTPEEIALLTDAILKAAQRVHRKETATVLAGGSHGRQRPPPDDGDAQQSQAMQSLQDKGVERIIDSFGAAGWEEVARLGPMGRTTEECWKQWVHQLRPSLTRGPWSDDENARLAGLVSRLGTHAWDEVAQALGSGRTPAACLAQYQQKHKGTELLNSRWTPEEATRLAQVIARLGTRDWQAVAAEMGGRTPGQVQHFYQDNLSSCYKKGSWAPEEDEKLKEAVRTVGKHWREVAKHVPRRTDKQCRERYANVLDPELRLYAEWTPEEDKLLLQAVEEHTKPNGKVKWAAVSRMVHGRTDNVCVRHYKMLMKADPPRQKKSKSIRGRSGRFIAWEKVHPPELPAAEAEPLQIEAAPASAPATKESKPRSARTQKRGRRKAAPSCEEEAEPLQVEAAPASAPAKKQSKPRSARASQRDKRKAAPSSEEELELPESGSEPVPPPAEKQSKPRTAYAAKRGRRTAAPIPGNEAEPPPSEADPASDSAPAPAKEPRKPCTAQVKKRARRRAVASSEAGAEPLQMDGAHESAPAEAPRKPRKCQSAKRVRLEEASSPMEEPGAKAGATGERVSRHAKTTASRLDGREQMSSEGDINRSDELLRRSKKIRT